MEGSGYGLIKVLSQYFPKGTEEDHEKSHSLADKIKNHMEGSGHSII
jgi:hypothetical protein